MAKVASFPLVLLVFLTSQCSTIADGRARAIQFFLQWNYTHFDDMCSLPSAITVCKDIRYCKMATASVVMGGWPAICGWVDKVVPKVCCGFPMVLGGALLRKVDEEKARNRECGRTYWEPGLSEIETDFFKILKDLPDVDYTAENRFDPPLVREGIIVPPVKESVSRQGDFPWMVSIRKNGKHLCGGSLIDRSHILTAAHCFYKSLKSIDPSEYAVHIGNINVTKGYRVNVKQIVIHENYTFLGFYHDIAMLTLEKEILNPHAAHICLPSPEFSVRSLIGVNTTLLGWGHTLYGGIGTSELKIVEPIPVVSTEKCSQTYHDRNETFESKVINNDFICSGVEEKDEICKSNLGGPLMYNDNYKSSWVLVGIVSYGFRCTESGSPAIYTRVSSHMSWILRKMKD